MSTASRFAGGSVAARLHGLNGPAHQGFDHAAFHATVHAQVAPTMVTCNAEFAPEYGAYPTCLIYDHGYTMQSNPDYRAKQGQKREHWSPRTASALPC